MHACTFHLSNGVVGTLLGIAALVIFVGIWVASIISSLDATNGINNPNLEDDE